MSRLAIGKFKAEPIWQKASALPSSAVSAELAEWLFDNDSLTKRLRQGCRGRFSVELLGQSWTRPLRCERQVLGLDDRAVALIRQVRLHCNGQPIVYARTVMPARSVSGRQRRLSCLGGRPLGEMLFRDRTMRRSSMEVAKMSADNVFYTHLQIGKRVWGRRSVFYLSDKPLLVNEVFISSLPKATGFRVKQRR